MSEAFHTDEQELRHKFRETKLPHIGLEARVLASYKKRASVGISKRWLGSKRFVAGYAFLAIAILFGTLASIPASAEHLKKLPVLGKIFTGDIFSFAGDRGIVNITDAGFASRFDEEAQDHGVMIRLQDVLYDGARLSIGYEIRSESVTNLLFLGDISIAVNGVVQLHPSISTKPYRIDGNHTVGILTLDIDSLDVAERFDLAITIGEVAGFKDEDSTEEHTIVGEWRFELAVTNNMMADIRHKALSDTHIAKSRGRQFQLTEYVLTPATTMLRFEFAGSRKPLFFELKDEHGMQIEFLDSQRRIDNDGISKGSVRFGPVGADTKMLYVTPYTLPARGAKSKKVTAPLTTVFPIVLSQGEVGEMIVNDVKLRDDKTLIYYEVQGTRPLEQATSLWLETTNGDRIVYGNGNRTRISDTSYTYILEYPPLDASQSYVLGTMAKSDVKRMEGLTIQVELD